MLTEQLDKLQSEGQPQKLDELFADNEESILYEKLTASLREAALGIKEQMKSELESMAENLSQEIVSKLKDSPVYNKLMTSVEETAMGMKDKMTIEIETIVVRNVREAVSKIQIPKDGRNGISPDPKEVAKLIAAQFLVLR